MLEPEKARERELWELKKWQAACLPLEKRFAFYLQEQRRGKKRGHSKFSLQSLQTDR